MTRPYTLKRRAEHQAKTRQRIVEAAVDLHRTVGPAGTTISMLADRAGVQRHTVYAHFPDERSLLMACSGLAHERDPMPEAAPWQEIVDVGERLRTGLAALYGWFERNADLAACVLRDAETHPLVGEIAALRQGPFIAAYQETLGESLGPRQRSLLEVALSFFTWRTLVRGAGLSTAAAAETMAEAILGA